MVGTLVFIDSRIRQKASLQTLFSANTEYFILDENRDGIEQMLGHLSGQSELDAIHIISHGSPGSITIGNTVLNESTLPLYSSELAAIGATLRDGGDILLYGCNVAAGTGGASFVEALATATDADLAASDDPTGAIPGRSDGELEFSHGTIEAHAITLPQDYPYLLDGADPEESEFRINTTTASAQTAAVASALASGGFVAVWTSNGQDGSNTGVFARRFNEKGLPDGNEFQVNTRTSGHQSNAAVASLSDHSFVITWQSYSQDGDSYGIYAQRFGSDGTALGEEFQVNTHTDESQSSASISALADGGFVIVWQSEQQDGDSHGIYLQRYNRDGDAVGTETQVNTRTALDQSSPSVTALKDGDFIVTWQSEQQDGSELGVCAQRFDSDGTALGEEFRVNTHTDNDQSVPAIAPLPDGGFVVTWQSESQDGSYWGIFGQRYDESGNPAGDEFQINTTTSYTQKSPAITPLSDGGFVVTWSSSGQDGNGYGIYGQRFDSNAALSGNEFQISTFTELDQIEPAITTLDDGGFVVVWQSDEQDGSDWGIYGKRFDADGNQLSIGNAPPTGAIRIAGANRTGQTLNAITDSLSDANGVGPLSLQWYANGIAIDEATGESYTLTDAELGKTILVTASYTDGDGFAEQLSSAATDPVGFSVLRLDGHRTVAGIEVQLWLKEHTVVDVMDLEFSYNSAEATYSGCLPALDQWEFLEAEPTPGLINFAGYASDFEPLDSDNELLVATITFAFVEDEPDFVFSVTEDSTLTNTLEENGEIDPGTLPELHAPELTGAIPDRQLDEDIPFSYTIDPALFVDQDTGDGDWLDFTAALADGSSLPAWLHFDNLTRTFSGTALNDDTGTIEIEVTATDQSGLSKSDRFSVTINNTNDTPFIDEPLADLVTDEKALFELTVPESAFIDPDADDQLDFSATLADGSDLPAWLTFEAESRSFHGTPQNEDTGTIEIMVTAADQSGASVADTFELTVNNINDAPEGAVTIDGSPTQNQSLMAITDSLDDADGLGAFSYQWYADNTPIDSATGSSYTLTETEVGASINVEVTYTDGHGTAEIVLSETCGPVENINDTPMGLPTIEGIARQGQTLSADTSAITDADGLSGPFSFQWYSGTDAIPGATTDTHLLTADEIGRKISLSVSWIDGHGTHEQLTSPSTLPVSGPAASISGQVSFWNSIEAINGVKLDITTESMGGQSQPTILFDNLEQHEDGSRTIEVWAESAEAFESLQFTLLMQQGSSAAWENAQTLPEEWISLTGTTNDREFTISGFGLEPVEAGTILLGTLTLSAPEESDRFELSVISGELGNTAISPFTITAATTQTEIDGSYLFSDMTWDNYLMTADKTVTPSDTSAITAADALAALKIAVGINPNSDESDLSTFQYLAADIDHDGSVRAVDALKILKLAVGHQTAPDPEWLIVDIDIQEMVMNRKTVNQEAADIDLALSGTTELNLVGVLIGDVNGSWTGT